MADEKRMVMSLSAAKEHFCSYMDERILLALAIKDMDCYYTLESKVDKNDFLSPEHSVLYSTLQYMHNKLEVKSFDLPNIINCVKDNEIVTSVGGIKYLKSIYNMPVNSENLFSNLKVVLDSSKKYKLYQNLFNAYIKITDAKDISSEDLISNIEAGILDLSLNHETEGPKDFCEGLDEFLENVRNNPVSQTGLDTGFPILNKQIDGLVPGTLHVISARKKMGKSAVLSAIARHVAYKLKIPVLYIDTEMTFNEFRTRNLAGLAHVEERKIKHGVWNDEENQKIDKAKEIIDKAKLFHEYMPGYSVDKITALYKKYKSKHNIGLAIFDYIKEPDSKSIDKQRKEYQVLGDVVTKLKDLAGVLNIPFLSAVQLNRQSDIADSDRIARYADIIINWEARDDEVLKQESDESPTGRPNGSHKLVVKDTRRGGTTPSEGIAYYFKKTMLIISEVPPHLQAIDYTKDSVNHGSVEIDEDDDLL